MEAKSQNPTNFKFKVGEIVWINDSFQGKLFLAKIISGNFHYGEAEYKLYSFSEKKGVADFLKQTDYEQTRTEAEIISFELVGNFLESAISYLSVCPNGSMCERFKAQYQQYLSEKGTGSKWDAEFWQEAIAKLNA